MNKKLMPFVLGGVFTITSAFAQTPVPVEILSNGGFESGNPPTNVNQVYNATGWSTGCALQTISGPPYPLGTPDLCDRSNPTHGIIGIPGAGVETRNGTSNRRFIHMLASVNVTSPENYGESIKGAITEPLAAGYTYSASCYYARTGYEDCISNVHNDYKIEFVLRKDDDCTLEKIVYTSANTIVDNTECVDGQYGNTWRQVGGVFSLTQTEVNQGFNRLEIRIKGKGTVMNELFVDDVSLTKRPSPEAHFQFTNPGTTVASVSSFYGPLPVTQLCQSFPSTCVTINGSASAYENGYYLSVSEFTPSTWTSATPMYSQWVSITSPVPSTDINLCNLPGVTFQPGKTYIVGLSVGPEWNTENHWIKINPTTTLSAIADQTICAGTSATITTISNGWPIKVYQGASLVGTYSNSNNSNQIILPPTTVTTTYKFLTSSKSGCASSDLVTITATTCATASFTFTNPRQTVAFENSDYGPIEVTTLCADAPNYCVGINGSASAYEDRYWITVSEFDFNPWGDIGTPLWNNWVCIGCTVPASKNLCDLTNLTGSHFQLGKLYRVMLAVGNPWHSTQKFVRITDCASQARLGNIGNGEDLSVDPIDNSINIYPNPTNGKFNIDFKEESVQAITVYDSVGKVVSETKTETNATTASFDLTNYPAGIYLVKINAGEKVVMKKVVKE